MREQNHSKSIERGLTALTVFWFAVAAFTVFAPDEWWGAWKREQDGIRTLAFIIAGVVGMGLAVWRSRIAERQTTIAERGQQVDRLSKAVEQLSSDKLYERIGGIHALQQIARTAEEAMDRGAGDTRHHKEDLEAARIVLYQFIRTPPYEKKQDKKTKEFEIWATALASHKEDHKDTPWN